jgi:magnesium-transporting ATPase (P-type)
MSTKQDIKYWALPKEALLRAFDTSTLGLDDAEVARRLKDDGFNEIPYAEHQTALTILLSKFKNPLVYVLIVASGIAGFLGDVTEVIIIVAILLANALLGFSQEYKSERALEELKKYLSYITIVFREGQKRTIDTKELVPGDLVYLAIGDIVPAEIRLLETDELLTNESALTGESTPVDKIASPIALDHPLPHQLVNTALMSSTVLNSSGMGLVVATGRPTYFGRVVSSLSLLPPKTDFQKNIASFGNFLIKVIVLLVLYARATSTANR